MMYEWLPKEFCKVGLVVKLKNDDGTWDDGWKVKEAFTGIELTDQQIRRTRLPRRC